MITINVYYMDHVCIEEKKTYDRARDETVLRCKKKKLFLHKLYLFLLKTVLMAHYKIPFIVHTVDFYVYQKCTLLMYLLHYIIRCFVEYKTSQQ